MSFTFFFFFGWLVGLAYSNICCVGHRFECGFFWVDCSNVTINSHIQVDCTSIHIGTHLDEGRERESIGDNMYDNWVNNNKKVDIGYRCEVECLSVFLCVTCVCVCVCVSHQVYVSAISDHLTNHLHVTQHVTHLPIFDDRVVCHSYWFGRLGANWQWLVEIRSFGTIICSIKCRLNICLIWIKKTCSHSNVWHYCAIVYTNRYELIGTWMMLMFDVDGDDDDHWMRDD